MLALRIPQGTKHFLKLDDASHIAAWPVSSVSWPLLYVSLEAQKTVSTDPVGRIHLNADAHRGVQVSF